MKTTILFLLFLLSELLVYKTVDIFFNEKKEAYLTDILRNVEKQYQSIETIFLDQAYNSFEGYINREDVKRAFANRDRETLYNLLEEKYKHLTHLVAHSDTKNGICL